MNQQQQDKEEEGGLGCNAQGERESKRIKLDLHAHSNIQQNQVDDGSPKSMKDALLDTSTVEQPPKTEYEDLSFLFSDPDPDNINCMDKYMESVWDKDIASVYDKDAYSRLQNKLNNIRGIDYNDSVRIEMDEELAQKGIDVSNIHRKNWKGKCEICDLPDLHPTEECPYGSLIIW